MTGSASSQLIDRAIKRPEAAPLAFLVVIALTFGATTHGFLSSANLVAVLSQVAVVGIVSLALNQVILSGEIDVSLGSMLAACAFAYAETAHWAQGALLPILAALGVGAVIGGLNGLLVTAGRVPSIIATLGMLMALRGGVLLLGSNGVLLVPDTARGFGLGAVLGAPAPILALILVFALFEGINRNTKWGRDVLAVGSNRRAADAVGLRTGWIKFRCFLATGLCCGLASLIFAGQIGQIQATAATGFELQCIAAAVLGGTSITGGRGSTVAPVIGAVLVGVILNALTLNKIPGTFEQLVLGLLILAAVSIDALRFHASRRR